MDGENRRPVLEALWMRRWLISACLAVVMLGSLLVSAASSPVYTAAAKVLVTPTADGGAIEAGGSDEVDLLTEIEIVESAVQGRALESLEGSADRVREIDVQQVPGTAIIEVSVESVDPQVAADAANSVAQTYVQRRRQQSRDGNGQVVERLQERASELQQRLNELEQAILRESTRAQPNQAKLSNDQVRFDDLSSRLESLNELADQYRLSATIGGGGNVVDEAETPSRPSSPSLIRSLVLAGAVGLVLGCGAAFAYDLNDDRVRTGDDFEQLLDGAATVVDVPAESPGRARRGKARVALLGTAEDQVGEAYESLAGTVRLMTAGSPEATMVTSPTNSNASTVVAANLALALVNLGQGVVLIGGDLSRPRVAWSFDVSNEVGLSSVLAGGANLEATVQSVRTRGGGALYIMSEGPRPRDPAGLLASEDMRMVIKRLHQGVDHVIIDAAPLIPTADGMAIARHADIAILAATQGRTTFDEIRRASGLLNDRSTFAMIGGVLLSRKDRRLSKLSSWSEGRRR